MPGLRFDRRPKLGFDGSRIKPNALRLGYHEADDALGSTTVVRPVFAEGSIGKNGSQSPVDPSRQPARYQSYTSSPDC